MSKKIHILLIYTVLIFLIQGGCKENVKLKEAQEVLIRETTFSFNRGECTPVNTFIWEYRLIPGDVLEILYQNLTYLLGDSYRLSPTQSVNIQFLNAPELNQTLRIQPNGMISLPYTGDILLGGKTIAEAREELRKQYRGMLKDPEDIYLTVTDFNETVQAFIESMTTSDRGSSRVVKIRPDGYCTFPLIGDMRVAGRSVPEIRQVLQSRYASIMPGLHFDVLLDEFTNLTIHVLGAVNTPGGFTLTKPITVMEAVAQAGGARDGADLSKVVILRKYYKNRVARKIDVVSALVGTEKASLIYLKPDDIIYVPKSSMTSMAEVMAQLQQIILFSGWSISTRGISVEAL